MRTTRSKPAVTITYFLGWSDTQHGLWARFHINKSRTTPYRIISGAEYTGELIPLGETVMAKFPRAANEKSAPRWIKGIVWRQNQQFR